MRAWVRKQLAKLPGWIDKLWPWGPIALLFLAFATGLHSILKQPPKTDQEQITALIHSFGKAIASQNGDDACGKLTPSGQRDLISEVPTVTCPVAVRSFSLGFDGTALSQANVQQVTIVGTQATVPREKLTTAANVSIGIGLALTKTGGHWQISGLARAPVQ